MGYRTSGPFTSLIPDSTGQILWGYGIGVDAGLPKGSFEARHAPAITMPQSPVFLQPLRLP